MVSVVAAIWILLMVLRFAVVPFDDVIDDRERKTNVMIGFLQTVDSLNPYVGLNDPSYLFYSLVYDCLTTVDEDMSPMGNLALSWWKVPVTDPMMVASGEPYGSVWEYNLTQNATWHDGAQFTADDVLFNMNINLQNYDTTWAFQPYTYFIKMVEKVGNYTVRFHFWDRATGDPMPVAWGDFIPIPMLPKHLLEQLPGASYITMSWTGTLPDDVSPGMPIVGTGPWMVTPSIQGEWTAGNHVTLVRNPNYHMKTDNLRLQVVPLDRLVMKFFQDSASMVIALKVGELDVAKLPMSAYDELVGEVNSGSVENITCFSGPTCAQSFVYLSFWMNASGGDNDARLDQDVRKAMALAIDRMWLVNNTFLGLADPGSTVVPPINSYWHYEPNASERLSFNITAANQLLESSGYVDIDADGIRECTIASKAVQMGWATQGDDLRVEVPVFENSYYSTSGIGDYVTLKWREIGMNATWYAIEDSIYPIYCPIQEDVSISSWSILDPDPQFILFTQSDAAIGGWSDTGFSDSSYSENFASSVSCLSLGARKAYVDACQRILYDQCPYIVLAYPHSNYAWREDVLGGWGDWTMNPGRSLDACWGANPLFFDLYPPVFTDNPESEPSMSSLALNVAIIATVAGTVLVVHVFWRGSSKAENPPKTGQ